VYEHADQSWRKQPKVISDATVARIGRRIADYSRKHALSTVHVIMHGGEVLLAGPKRLQGIARELNEALDGVAKLDLRIHTNGVLLNEEFCEVFEAANIKVGVSLDGDRVANDRHRRYANGRSSYDQVIAAITLLRDRYPHLYAGLLCTIDIRNDPIRVYEALLALKPPRIDFLLPHATWDRPPLRPEGADTAYADWLIAIHDRWRSDGRPIAIRLFDSITWNARGRIGGTESLGLSPSDLIVIETDGSYEQVDSLKVAYDGAPAMNMDVFSHSLDEAMEHPGVAARQGGITALSADCQACPVVASCGGGLYAHRYRTGTGFANPSVYCSDLRKLVAYVEGAARPRHTFPADALDAMARAGTGPREVELVQGPQLSLTRMLVASAGSAAADRPVRSLLTDLERAHRDIADQVFRYPFVRSWAARRAGRDPAARVAVPGHLGAVAAAIAIRAGESVRVTVPVRNGAVHLPTVGRMLVTDAASALVETAPGAFTVRAGTALLDQGSAAWQPVRTLEAQEFTLPLDDVDPHRDCYPGAPLDRLDDGEFAEWRETFTDAWKLLAAEYPEQAAAIREGIQAVTPMSGPPGRFAIDRHAYGAVALSRCVDAETLAKCLVGGFASAQLTALRDLFDLTGRDARAADELNEAYVLLATAPLMDRSAGKAALEQVLRTVDRLNGESLPDVGRRFRSGMRAAALAGVPNR
jgi:uncharacterized protein